MFGIIGSSDDDHDMTADLSSTIVATSIIMMIISPVIVGLRLYARRMIRQPLLLDDWLILAALPFSIAPCALNIVSVQYANYGRHFLTSSFGQMALFLKMLIPYEVCWVTSVALTKLSILAFYRRIFSTPNTKWPALILAVMIILFELVSVPILIMSCNPISKYWNPSTPGTCQNFMHQMLGSAIPNVIFDCALWVFPIPLLVALQLPKAKKIAIIGIFMLGGFVIVIASLRMVTIVQAYKTILDTTWVLIPIGLFSVIETNVGVACACLPSLTPLIKGMSRRHNSSAQYTAGTTNTTSTISGSTLINSIRARIPSTRGRGGSAKQLLPLTQSARADYKQMGSIGGDASGARSEENVQVADYDVDSEEKAVRIEADIRGALEVAATQDLQRPPRAVVP